MTTAAIVQARSAQFQDKDLILQPLGAKSALIRVLDRCARIAGVDQVICTITPYDGADYAADSAHVTVCVAKSRRSTKTLSYANARMAMCWTKTIPTRELSICLLRTAYR